MARANGNPIFLLIGKEGKPRLIKNFPPLVSGKASGDSGSNKGGMCASAPYSPNQSREELFLKDLEEEE